MPNEFKIGKKLIGLNHPSYFVADIAANHDGDLQRALELIELAADAGADAAKFQNFSANTIVSDLGFRKLSGLKSHQSSWKDGVYSIYDKASISTEWSRALKEKCDECKIEYFTAPYNLDIIDELDKYVCAWKVGSGDVNWIDLIENLSKRKKPILIATGASTFNDVISAYNSAKQNTDQIVLMQCNTNYTGSLENFKYINLNVLNQYKENFPGTILGLSDHTPGHASVLGAIALGARVIEKHFTDDKRREGPDHKFSMDPTEWKEMVARTRELENALGDGLKKVEENEKETYVLQRRALRATVRIEAGSKFTMDNVIPLRPCPSDGMLPNQMSEVTGRICKYTIEKGDLIRPDNLI